MNHFPKSNKLITILLAGLFFIVSDAVFAQSDTTQVDNTQKEKKEKKDKKRKDEFKIYGGLSLNHLLVSSDTYNSTLAPGWMLGVSYKRGKFFYWELGVRYNNAVYNLDNPNIPADSSNLLDGVFAVRNIDVPVTVGLNFLSFASRIVGLRLFVGVTPEFAIGVGGNDLGIDKDNINTFNLLGHGGIGVDVAFIYLETSVNYGFVDVFKNDVDSNPFQIFVCLGFRF